MLQLMCGAAALTKRGVDYFIAKMKADKVWEGEYGDKYNLRPQQLAPVIYSKEGRNIARLGNFGLVPSWSKDRYPKFSTINARSEDIDKKPTYSKPFKNQRCILPAVGYYEWIAVSPKEKVPYYHQLKDGRPFAMACVYDENTIADAKPIFSFSILTKRPGAKLAKIHERKPILLNEDEVDAWLNPEEHEVIKLKKLLDSISEDEIEVYRVSQAVNSSRSEGEELIRKVT